MGNNNFEEYDIINNRDKKLTQSMKELNDMVYNQNKKFVNSVMSGKDINDIIDDMIMENKNFMYNIANMTRTFNAIDDDKKIKNSREDITDSIENMASTFDTIDDNKKIKDSNEDLTDSIDILSVVENKSDNVDIGGITYGNISNASNLYGMDKFNTPRGHGFAAERANHLNDKISNFDFLGQNKVNLVGDDIDPLTGKIVKNGADRIVNGVEIQTKYCRTGSKCIAECFDKNGEFRYFSKNGNPMQIEVPSDKYDDAIQAMRKRIENGQVRGVTDPNKAKDIVKKGSITYQQAKNIAKAGNIDSIKYDLKTGAITSTYAFGVTSLVTFAKSIWDGEEFDVALKNSAWAGIKTGGITLATSFLSQQVMRTGVSSVLVGGSEAFVGLIGPKASAMLVNAFRSGSNIYGAAAMKSAAKMLRGNIIVSGASILVLSTVDILDIFRGRISGKQFVKNVLNLGTSVIAGGAGWVAGTAAGAKVGTILGSVVPGIGNIVGGAVGGLFGLVGATIAGTAGGELSKAVTDVVIGEDDAEEMLRILEEEFTELAQEYLLNKNEAEKIASKLQNALDSSTLKDMYEASSRIEFCRELLIPIIENEIIKRKKISAPSYSDVVKGIKLALEEMADLNNGLVNA